MKNNVIVIQVKSKDFKLWIKKQMKKKNIQIIKTGDTSVKKK